MANPAIRLVRFRESVRWGATEETALSAEKHKCSFARQEGGIMVEKPGAGAVWVPASNIRFIEYEKPLAVAKTA